MWSLLLHKGIANMLVIKGYLASFFKIQACFGSLDAKGVVCFFTTSGALRAIGGM